MAKKNTKNNKGCLIIFIIIGLSIGLYFYFTKDNNQSIPFISEIKKIFIFEDLTSKFQEVDQAIIEVLGKLEIQDKDVIEEYREEKKEWGVTWIEVNRKISISTGALLEDYQLKISKEVSKFGALVTGELSQNKEKEIQLTLIITLKERILEKLIIIKKIVEKKN